MKFYLAARYSRLDEMEGVATVLRAYGHEVTSRWHKGDHQISDEGLSDNQKKAERERFAREDMEDLTAAECCLNFTEPPRSTNSRGGRHVELGIAIGQGKRVVVIGPRENVFHCLPEVSVYPSAGFFFKDLAEETVNV